MRFPLILLAYLSCLSCVGPAVKSGEWEYRVLAVPEYYGCESASAFDELMSKQTDIWAVALDAMNRWAAAGWEHVPGEADTLGYCVLMRRNRASPAPFEVRWLMQKDLEASTAVSVRTRIDDLIREGWFPGESTETFAEFRRYL